MGCTCLIGANDVMILKETAGRRQRLRGPICASGPDWGGGCLKVSSGLASRLRNMLHWKMIWAQTCVIFQHITLQCSYGRLHSALPPVYCESSLNGLLTPTQLSAWVCLRHTLNVTNKESFCQTSVGNHFKWVEFSSHMFFGFFFLMFSKWKGTSTSCIVLCLAQTQ